MSVLGIDEFEFHLNLKIIALPPKKKTLQHTYIPKKDWQQIPKIISLLKLAQISFNLCWFSMNNMDYQIHSHDSTKLGVAICFSFKFLKISVGVEKQQIKNDTCNFFQQSILQMGIILYSLFKVFIPFCSP